MYFLPSYIASYPCVQSSPQVKFHNNGLLWYNGYYHPPASLFESQQDQKSDNHELGVAYIKHVNLLVSTKLVNHVYSSGYFIVLIDS